MHDKEKMTPIPQRVAIEFKDDPEPKWMQPDVALDILRGHIPLTGGDVPQGMFPYPHIWVEGPVGGGKTRFTYEVGIRNGLRMLFEPGCDLFDQALSNVQSYERGTVVTQLGEIRQCRQFDDALLCESRKSFSHARLADAKAAGDVYILLARIGLQH